MMSLRPVIFCCLLATMIGCGAASSDAPPRRIVEGSVTYDGKPLPSGMIRFVPIPAGPVASAPIVDGKYEITNKEGVPLGEAKVEIEGGGGADSLTQDQIEAGMKSASIVLPAKYNRQSTLTETISEGSGPQVIDFALTK